MRRAILASLRAIVRLRSGDRCEYCRLPQRLQEATFHIDHVVPVAAAGQTSSENLALACVSCSLRKAARSLAVDPETGRAEALYSPRLHAWTESFSAQSDGTVTGLTASGRATVVALALSRPIAVLIRQAEAVAGRWP
ncbi:MAG: HNH endonuclease [Deltaproteobacteria bacterium]|nr:HNH endonuclease [Deltaproteobacteria bacterium]